MLEILKPDFVFNDDRGNITQLVHAGYAQVNVIFSRKGSIRGRHYHKQNDEVFYIISGKCRVTLEDESGEIESYIFTDGDIFKIMPFISHQFEYLNDTVLVSMYSNGVELGDGLMDSYSSFND